jgi:hypothetical protein
VRGILGLKYQPSATLATAMLYAYDRLCR